MFSVWIDLKKMKCFFFFFFTEIILNLEPKFLVFKNVKVLEAAY